MILVLFVTLGLLLWQICCQLDRRGQKVEPSAADCGECGETIGDDWLICPRCKSLVQQHCPGCSGLHAVSDTFCPWCGIRREGRTA
ncbi:hypothetical protein EDC39_10750 [Geothermobacter ehrlichii]|uniref:DZANK-type domain-containing protein n=1 Tax=Geothermobacter ehrlichii TaxID=213224 RepID=A0A5D3WJ08_9BACT|nr:zinc ribbon domain-containing protein [Geothermobacter ehrlichii]TYO98255.1 hypothetical protein EDC39_10750 [Geothermobacter ehrlichii]